MIYKNKYVSLLSDAGFKAVYADPQNKSLLIDLLNELLPPPAYVEDIIEYCDREQLAETVDSKRPVLDLICRGKTGEKFIVEMQKRYYEDFFQRMVYYGAGVYHNPLQKGEGYFQLKPVYVISILNHTLKHEDECQWDSDHIISHYEFMETRTKEFAGSTISITFAEMPRFRKKRSECATYRDMLFQVFRDGKQWDSVPDEFSEDKRICAVMNACEFARFDADKKLKFELEMLNEFDRENHLRQEREKGLQEGLQQGLQQGLEQGRANRTIEIVRKMLSDGLDVELVAKYTGLSSDEISALKE